MLHPDSKERFSAEECLKHNYFKKCDSNQGSLAEFEESKIDENITEAKNINIAKLDKY